MKKLLIAAFAALLFVSVPAQAGLFGDTTYNDSHDTYNKGGSVRDSGNSNVHTSTSTRTSTKQKQDQEQGQLQGQLQGQAQKAKANNEGVTGNSVEFTQTYEAGNYAPDAYAPSTASCTIGIGGSFGNSVFSGGMSTGYTDEVCRDLEVVRAGVNSTDPEMQKGAKKLYGLVLNDRLSRYNDNAKTTAATGTPDN